MEPGSFRSLLVDDWASTRRFVVDWRCQVKGSLRHGTAAERHSTGRSASSCSDPLRQERLRRNNNAGSGSLQLRSEEHTSELQSLTNIVCRLLLEKKKWPTRSTENFVYCRRSYHSR